MAATAAHYDDLLFYQRANCTFLDVNGFPAGHNCSRAFVQIAYEQYSNAGSPDRMTIYGYYNDSASGSMSVEMTPYQRDSKTDYLGRVVFENDGRRLRAYAFIETLHGFYMLNPEL